MIYFIQAMGTSLVKIGFTADDPMKRLRELQTGSAHQLRLIAAIPGDEEDEKKLHQKFRGLRQKGEWFLMSEEIAQLFKDMSDQRNRSLETAGAVVAQAIQESLVSYGFVTANGTVNNVPDALFVVADSINRLHATIKKFLPQETGSDR